VLFESDPGGGRPLLDHVLKVDDSTVSVAVMVNGNTSFLSLAFKVHRDLSLAMVRLLDLSQEHPLGSDNQGDTQMLLLLQVHEVEELLVAVHQALGIHLGRSNLVDRMREFELVDKDEALLGGIKFVVVNRDVVVLAEARLILQTLFVLLHEGELVGDHHVEGHLREGDL